MRLINAHTLKLEDVLDEHEKEYAILSHRWEGEEVTFRDMQDLSDEDIELPKFSKIRKSCEQAVKDGHDFVWVDTCCIDKSSSAELSEAINSMFRWYKAAAVCYALLGDIPIYDGDNQAKLAAQVNRDAQAIPKGRMEIIRTNMTATRMGESQWFERGWTLQELLAPRIDGAILRGTTSIHGCSIAQRMSWASERITKRPEDTAYCLLGIFDITMPLLYGEGSEKAFLRLQTEIMETSDDHSLFAWPIQRDDQHGLLAASPAAFVNCGGMVSTTSRKGKSPYSLTNRGLALKLPASCYVVDTYLVVLECRDDSENKKLYSCRLGMFLRRLEQDDQFARIRYDGKTFLDVDGEDRSLRCRVIEMYVRQSVHLDTNDSMDRVNGFHIVMPEKVQAAPRYLHQDRDGMIALMEDDTVQAGLEKGVFFVRNLVKGHNRMSYLGQVAELEIRPDMYNLKKICLGFDFHFNPVCFLATAEGLIDVPEDTRDDWTVEERNQLRALNEQDAYNENLPWDDNNIGRAGGYNGLPLHPGIWVLKGDRLDGLREQFVGLRNSVGYVASVHMTRGKIGDKLIWDVIVKEVS